MISFRPIEHGEISRLGEIDRAEEIVEVYQMRDGRLVLTKAPFLVPNWAPVGDTEYTVNGVIAQLKSWLNEDAALVGAFDGEKLVGIGLYRSEIATAMGQLAFLHVSKSYRRQGIGAELARLIITRARLDNQRFLYVSATPTRGTVDFYRSLGFTETLDVDPKLFELEPDDIHMKMQL